MKKISLLALTLLSVMSIGMTACKSGEPSEDGSNVSSSEVQGNSGNSQGDIITDKEVESIAMDKLPTKTKYYVGETFSPEGGSILVTYVDKSTSSISLTSEGVTLSTVNTSRVGEKTVTVTYQKKRTTFKVEVVNEGFKVTFDLNYEDGKDFTIDVTKNQAVEKPADPTREGFDFYAWYTDEACTTLYDFSAPVTQDLTLYAFWEEEGMDYFDVVFDLNYYGVAPQTYVQRVKSGDKARSLSFTPTRDEFRFDGWFTDAQGTQAFTSDVSISANTNIFAKWTKSKTGTSTYVFEAEETDLSGKTGPGFSGSASEEGMIVSNSTLGASNNKYVSYLYRSGLTLDFYIASSETVNDATLTVSVAAEMKNIAFNDEEYQVIVNDVPQSFSNVSLIENAEFSDAINISNVSLKEGFNSIILKTNNTKRPMGEGSTYAATAPMVDCLKLTTSSVLMWDENKGLPMEY